MGLTARKDSRGYSCAVRESVIVVVVVVVVVDSSHFRYGKKKGK